MNKLRLGNGFVIFVLFFGVATVQAIRDWNWGWIAFWIVSGTLFLLADNMGKNDKKRYMK